VPGIRVESQETGGPGQRTMLEVVLQNVSLVMGG
jgi:hypothetical protein